MNNKTCLFCVVEIKSSKKNRKYCSLKCQQSFQRKLWVDDWLNGKEVNFSDSSNRIKSFLFHDQGGCCIVCKNKDWNGLPIPLSLDHVDGNFFNCSRENVRLICLNCHALTPNYKAKNKGNGRKSRSLKILRGHRE